MRSRPLLLSSVRRSSASRRLGAVGVSLVLATMLVATSASAATMVLSYTAGASGHGETELVELAADGPIVRGKLPGLVAAVRGQPVWLKPQAVKVRTVDCECVMNLPDPDSYDESKPPAACTKPRSLQVLALHNATTGKVTAIGKAPDLLSDGEGEGSWSIEVLGQAGTVLLAVDKRYSSSCGGAHGSESSELLAIDLATGKAVEPWTKAERAAVLAAGRTKAIAALKAALAKDGGDEFEGDTEQSLAVVALAPQWNQAGTMLARYLLQVDWHYAGGDGVWGSYSRSTWLQLPQVPAALKAGGTLPAGLRQHWAKVGKGKERFGWSYVDEIAAPAVSKLFSVKAAAKDASVDVKVKPARDDAPPARRAAPSRPQRPGR